MGSSGRLWKENAQRSREIASHNSRSATGRPGQMRRLVKKLEVSRYTSLSEGMKLPSAECPMVPFHDVGKLGRFTTAEVVPEVPVRIEFITVNAINWLQSFTTYVNLRIRVTFFIVMESVTIEDHDCVLGNVHSLIHEILARAVRGCHPEWCVYPLDLSMFKDRRKSIYENTLPP